MAKMHKDYTIADMLRLGGAWVKTYKDVESLQKIAGTLAMMDKGTTDVTVERFMLPDKSIESDPDRIKAICLSIDGGVHTVSKPIKLSSINKALIETKLKSFSSSIVQAMSDISDSQTKMARAFEKIRSTASLPPVGLTEDINPTEACTFKYFGKYNSNSYVFVQTVPTNLSRVDSDGTVTQRCLGRYAAVVLFSQDGTISVKVGGVVDGLHSDGHVHPNVKTTGGVCFGEGNSLAATLEAKGDVVGLLSLLDRVLRTSQYGSPYRGLSTFSEASRASVITNNGYDSLEGMLSSMSTLLQEPVKLSGKVLVMPNDDIKQMFNINSNGLVEVTETDDPDVYYVSGCSSVLVYAPASLFTHATVYNVPTAGVYMYKAGGYSVDGNLYGSTSIYEQPVQVDRLDTSGLTDIVHGICIVDDELYKTISKYVDGVMVASFAFDGEDVRRVTQDRASDIYPIATMEANEWTGVKRIIDIENGLACAVGSRVIAASVLMERIESYDVAISDSNGKYWFK